MKKVLCPYCNDGVLQSFEGGGEDYSGYVCEYGSTDLEILAKEDGCSRIIDTIEYKKLVKKQTSSSTEPPTSDNPPTTPVNTPAAPLARLVTRPPLNRLPMRPTAASNPTLSRPGPPTGMATRSAPGGRPLVHRPPVVSMHKGRGRSKAKSKGSDSEGDWEGESTSEDEKQPLSFDSDEDEEEAAAATTDGLSTNEQYNANAALMRVGNEITVARASIFPGLTVQGMENALAYGMRKRFVPPKQDAAIARTLPWDAKKLGHTLGVNRYAIQKKMSKFMIPVASYRPPENAPGVPDADGNPTVFTPPAGFQPLVVWAPTEEDQAAHIAAHSAASITNPDAADAGATTVAAPSTGAGTGTASEIPPLTPIEVPPILAHWLRPHQREGVQFLCECTLEQRDFRGQGAILADDMGLGKTLQSVALIYTLLTQGFQKGCPVAKKVIVCCPTSLVRNWANEFEKWIGPGVVNVVALAESSKDAVLRGIRKYVLEPQVQVLIISYETFRRYASRIYQKDCDLLVCDEAHRLKNAETATYAALNKLKCRRRVLLSGTPMQNDLGEFFAMVNFTNQGILGDASAFGRKFEGPILRGREPGSSDKERKLGEEKALELSQLVNMFILRRTNTLLSKHLPPKVMEVVCCNLTPLQKAIYQHFQNQKVVADLVSAADVDENEELVLSDDFDPVEGTSKKNDKGEKGERGDTGGKQILPLIGLLKGLCSHPKLVYEALQAALKSGKSHCPGLDGELLKLFPPDFEKDAMHPRYSGKMTALDRLMCTVRAHSTDKFVLISNYTQTLDIFEALCKFRGWEYLRVDGGTSIKARQERVDQLCAAGSTAFVFLLSSKAGGCGLNLIGANRLVLFDPDWNPAVDKQAAARVWRDGQAKRCFVYRFLASGSIEEKVYQRQLSKEGLADVVGGNNSEASVSMKELKDLFRLRLCISDTHDTLACRCAKDGEEWDWEEPQEDEAEEEGSMGMDGDTDDEEEEKQKKEEEQRKSAKKKKEIGVVYDSGSGAGAAEEEDKKDNDDDSMMDEADKLERELLRQKKSRDQKKSLVSAYTRQTCVWRQRGNPAEDDLANWSHHYSVLSVPDVLMRMTHTSVWKGTGYPNAPIPTHEPVPPPVPISALIAASARPVERIGIVRAIARPMATAHLTQAPPALQWRALALGGTTAAPMMPVRASKRIGLRMGTDTAAGNTGNSEIVEIPGDGAQHAERAEGELESPVKSNNNAGSGTSPGKNTSPSKFRIPVSRTASPTKDRLGMYDPLCEEPVLFVFACEIDGKPLDGIEEDLNKSVTVAVDDGRQRPRRGKGKVVSRDSNEDPNANLVEVVPRSRLPLHLRLKEEEDVKDAAASGASDAVRGGAKAGKDKKRRRGSGAGSSSSDSDSDKATVKSRRVNKKKSASNNGSGNSSVTGSISDAADAVSAGAGVTVGISDVDVNANTVADAGAHSTSNSGDGSESSSSSSGSSSSSSSDSDSDSSSSSEDVPVKKTIVQGQASRNNSSNANIHTSAGSAHGHVIRTMHVSVIDEDATTEDDEVMVISPRVAARTMSAPASLPAPSVAPAPVAASSSGTGASTLAASMSSVSAPASMAAAAPTGTGTGVAKRGRPKGSTKTSDTASSHSASDLTSGPTGADASGLTADVLIDASAKPKRGRKPKSTSAELVAQPTKTRNTSASPATTAASGAKPKRKRQNSYGLDYGVSEEEMLAWAMQESMALAAEQERKSQEVKKSQESLEEMKAEEEKDGRADAMTLMHQGGVARVGSVGSVASDTTSIASTVVTNAHHHDSSSTYIQANTANPIVFAASNGTVPASMSSMAGNV